MKQSYLLLLSWLLPLWAFAQSLPLILQADLQTLGDVTLQPATGEPGIGKAVLTENSRFLTQWEGETGIKILTLQAGIGKEIAPLTLQVPAKHNTYFQTTKGTTRLQQLTGYIEGGSQSGDLFVEQVMAKVRLYAKTGNITIENSQLDGDLIAPTGDITLTDVGGSYSTLSSRGQVRATFSERYFSSIDKPFRFGFAKGDLTAVGAKAGVQLGVQNGSIKIQKSQQVSEAVIEGAGDIRMEGVSGRIRARVGKGSVWVETLPEVAKELTQSIDIENNEGDVTLLLPADVQGLLVIEMIQSQGLEKPYTIESNTEWVKQARWEEVKGEKETLLGRRLVHQHKLGDSKRLIRIRVRNGNLTLKTY